MGPGPETRRGSPYAAPGFRETPWDDPRQASLEGSPTWEAAGAPGPADEGDGAPPSSWSPSRPRKRSLLRGMPAPWRGGGVRLPCVPRVSPLPSHAWGERRLRFPLASKGPSGARWFARVWGAARGMIRREDVKTRMAGVSPLSFPPSFPPSLSRFVFKTGSEILI